MKTFERTSLPESINYNKKLYVRGPKTDKSIIVKVLSRNLKGCKDLHGKFYKPTVFYFNSKD